MKQFFLISLFYLFAYAGFPQHATISGYIKDAANGEALIGATCFAPEVQRGTISNRYGFYSITLPEGNKINFSFIGYESKSVAIDPKKNQIVDIYLKKIDTQLNDVTVTASRKNENIASTEMSMDKLRVQLVKKLPAFMGEVDVLKTITLLPGIQSGGEGNTGLYVRGGGPDENLILLDEAPVYNASHLMGFFSVFNSDAIKDIKVYKGGIPAKYGGKASAVVDISMDDGNSKKFSGKAGIGNISSRLTLEGPIIKDKWSFILSGRRTYADVLGRMVGIDELDKNRLYFYDLNLKTNIHFSHYDRLFISAYTGDDYFKFGESMYVQWGNLTSTIRWNHIFSGKLFSNRTFIFSRYDYNLGVPGDEADQFDWNSKVQDFNFKEDYSWFINTDNQVDFGLNLIRHHFEPGNISANENSFFETLKLTHYNAWEGALYASNKINIGYSLTFKYGLRLSFFQQIGKGKVREYKNPAFPDADEVISETSFSPGERIGSLYINPEPRVSMKISTGTTSSVKASYNRMVQNVHLISNTNSPTPLDIWLPTSKYLKPLIANQAAAGYFRNFKQNRIETSLELYYKDMQNVLDYKDGAELFFNEDLETEILNGSGYSYGMEFLAKKQEGYVTGWVSYTLSKTMREIPGINNGKPYPSAYDRTHDLSVVMSFNINQESIFSANWVYATGNPVTYPVAKYDVQGNTLFYYAERNSSRLPDYHRLDLSFTYDSKKNEHRKVKRTLNVSLYNVYKRRNAYSIYFRQNEDMPSVVEATRLSIIGTIIPSITYNINF